MTKDEKLEKLNKAKDMFIKVIDNEMIQDIDNVDDDIVDEFYKEIKQTYIILKSIKEINKEE